MFTRTTGARGASGWRRRAVAAGGALALTGAVALTSATAASAAPVEVDDATFTWGLNGYAQKGIFGPWTFKDLTGNVTQLVGSVSGGSQTEYVTDPVPATSFPADQAGKTPNAVKFTAGTGEVDPETGAGTLSWTGSYTVNAYPESIGAPNEVYADPQLEVAADGSGELSVEFSLGAGTDMSGNPVEGQDFGRITLLTFSEDSISGLDEDGYRLTPDYQGVLVPEGAGTQTTNCTDASGATGWWGAWAPEFVNVIDPSVRPHFYSTGCGGMQDLKPALPIDIGYTAEAPVDPEPTALSVNVSKTSVAADGTTTLTVTGSGFDPSLANGNYPPVAGLPSGFYVAFGRYADVWKPTEGAPASARHNVPSSNGTSLFWVMPQESFDGSASPVIHATDPGYALVQADGTFSVDVQVNAAWLADVEGNYGIYTYGAGGNKVAQYETFTPITFVDENGLPIEVTIPEEPVEPEPGVFSWTIDGGNSAVSLGTAEVREDGAFTASGALHQITVTDTREVSEGWSISGQVSNFTNATGDKSFGGQSLGWTPSVSDTAKATAGAAITPGTEATDGLKSPRSLAHAASATGELTVDAGLSLVAPSTTEPGSYTATLTLTALS